MNHREFYEESAPESQEAWDYLKRKGMTHAEWLNNEYNQWIAALQESTVDNFKEHPMARRMLGEPDGVLFFHNIKHNYGHTLTQVIDRIGTKEKSGWPTYGLCMRYIYYAQQVLACNPSSICEIGGGVGQFYAILRALGYTGDYYIRDLKPVQEFQRKYLDEVAKQTGLDTRQTVGAFDMLVSFYALGEFTDEMKQMYRATIVDHIPHGYIAFNPHSGASDDLSIFSAHDIKVTPGIEEGIKIIEW